MTRPGTIQYPEPVTRDWRHDAACRDEEPELFFPIDYDSIPGVVQTETAKAVCNRCPVADFCLDFAMTTRGLGAGIFGGLTSDERNQLRCRTADNGQRPKTAPRARKTKTPATDPNAVPMFDMEVDA